MTKNKKNVFEKFTLKHIDFIVSFGIYTFIFLGGFIILYYQSQEILKAHEQYHESLVK